MTIYSKIAFSTGRSVIALILVCVGFVTLADEIKKIRPAGGGELQRLYPMAERQRSVMQIKPNRTILQGDVRHIERAADGWGANVEFAVKESKPADGFPDFLQAQPGSLVTAFAADPDAIEAGKSYTITASVLGGPQGERVIIEKVDAAAK
jgi:hypothetical protein